MFPESEKILIVDHDETRHRLIETLLRDEGFSVISAHEGLAALRAIGHQDFALVIAAIGLPGTLDGVTTIHQARIWRPGLKALMLAEPAQPRQWRSRNADDVIATPVHRWELLGCVFELLHRDAAAEATDLSRRCRDLRHAS